MSDVYRMRAQADDRPGKRDRNGGRWWLIVLAVLFIIGCAVGFILLRSQDGEQPPDLIETSLIPLESPSPVVESITASTDTVEQVTRPQINTESKPSAPLPQLDDSDSVVRGSLIKVLGDGRASSWLPQSDIIRRQTVFLNGLREGTLLRKPLPLPVVSGKFVAEEKGDRLILSRQNYRRYEPVVALLETIDIDAVGEWYRHYEPLLDAAWTELGNNDESLRRAIDSALQGAIATPDIAGELDLVRPGVLFKFADPRLEELSDVQKLLLRVGPDNRSRIKAICRKMLESLFL